MNFLLVFIKIYRWVLWYGYDRTVLERWCCIKLTRNIIQVFIIVYVYLTYGKSSAASGGPSTINVYPLRSYRARGLKRCPKTCLGRNYSEELFHKDTCIKSKDTGKGNKANQIAEEKEREKYIFGVTNRSILHKKEILWEWITV